MTEIDDATLESVAGGRHSHHPIHRPQPDSIRPTPPVPAPPPPRSPEPGVGICVYIPGLVNPCN
jgi:hypothetical protein